MKPKTIAVLAFCFLSPKILFAQGYLVANGVTSFPGSPSAGIEIRVFQNPNGTDYTGFNLRPEGGDLFLFNPLADEGVRTFLVNFNDTISLQPIQVGSYIELLTPNTYTFAHGVPFYVGLYTGPHYPQNGVYKDPLFGWARLENVGGKIQLLDSALVYNAAGIQAGTTTILQVPEPGPLALAALGLLALGGRWRTARPGPDL